MPKISKEKIGLMFGYYASDYADRCVSVGVRAIVSLIDFCAIACEIFGRGGRI